MPFFFTQFFSRVRARLLLVFLASGLIFSATAPLNALATDLPPSVLSYLRQKDPKVRVRFDGLVLFSNGETYVPVIPQDPLLNTESQQVIATLPEGSAYPDLIQFDNNFFLMRLVLTASGRLTFPKMDEYPLQLKEGLLPQDFVLPNNLFIPVELKVILGALPYNPTYVPEAKPVIVPPAVALSQGENGEDPRFSVKNRLTYIFDLNEQKIWAIESLTGKKLSDVVLDGVPANLKLAPDGKLLFVTSLSSNELVVVDTGSNLVKTRVSVGQRPDSILYVPQADEVVISNRFSDYLSIVNVGELEGQIKVTLPGRGGVLSLIVKDEKSPKILVADSTQPKIYVVDLTTRTVENTLTALPDISAMKALKTVDGTWEIWVASRTKSQVAALDLAGKITTTLDVGKKPVELAAYNNQLLVLSAGDARIDRVDLGSRTLLPSIALPEETFPSSLVIVPSEQRAYITAAGSTDFIIVNLPLAQVEKNTAVSFRASMLTMQPDEALPDAEKITVKPTWQAQPEVSQGATSKQDKTDVRLQVRPGTQSGPKVSGKLSVFKFGKEAPSKTPKGVKSDGSPSQMDNVPVKPGARLGQPSEQPETSGSDASFAPGREADVNPTSVSQDELKPLGD